MQLAIDAAVARGLETNRAELQLERADHERQTVVSCLQSYLAGNAGDNMADLKFPQPGAGLGSGSPVW